VAAADVRDRLAEQNELSGHDLAFLHAVCEEIGDRLHDMAAAASTYYAGCASCKLVTSVLPLLTSNPGLRPQWQHRLRTFIAGDLTARWEPYR
jgi:hypothetical protein